MGLFAEDRKFVLEELDINLLLLNLLLSHYLDSECFLGIFVHAKSDETESALSEPFAECVSYINILHFLEFLIISHGELFSQSVIPEVAHLVGLGLSGGIRAGTSSCFVLKRFIHILIFLVIFL